jgi:hypothetical protein
MRKLAIEGMTMLVVTHEMSFAREVADRVVFMDGGVIVEQASPPSDRQPRHARTPTFLQRVLNPAAAGIGELPETGPTHAWTTSVHRRSRILIGQAPDTPTDPGRRPMPPRPDPLMRVGSPTAVKHCLGSRAAWWRPPSPHRVVRGRSSARLDVI